MSNLGVFYLSNGINSSTAELNLATKYFTESLVISNDYNATIYRHLGIISYLQNKPKIALTQYNRGIESLLDIKLDSLQQLPSNYDVNNCNNKKLLLSVLFEKYYAWIKYYERDKNMAYLNYAMETITMSDYVLDNILQEITDEKSMLFWRKEASSFYLLGVHISHLLNNPEKAFYFTEKNKSLLLLNHTITQKNKSEINIPRHFINKEAKLKKEIFRLQNLINTNPNDSLRNLLFIEKRNLETQINSIKKIYPKYTNSLQETSIYSLTDVQKKIPDNTIYLTYIWDKTENQYDALYCIALTNSFSKIIKINNLNKFNEAVNDYRVLCSKPFISKNDIDIFKNKSFELYHALFPTDDVKKLILNSKKIVIFPDSDLQYISFESLITKQKSNDYLIKNNEINYAYSVSFLIENSKLKRNPKNNFSGYAPTTFNRQNLVDLIKSKSEVENIKNIISGKIFLNNEASKENFFKESSISKIIHIASHASADNSIEPWIAFKNEKLKLHELYTYKNQADLVFLSACETSLGETSRGEGVFSLARGFFFSGANSVISSLWSVDDKSTQQITKQFYKHLKDGKTKSTSLRLAKLDYLNTHSLSEVSPYYWSSLILIGDNSSIDLNNNLLFYIVLAVFLLIIIFFILKKKKTEGNKF